MKRVYISAALVASAPGVEARDDSNRSLKSENLKLTIVIYI